MRLFFLLLRILSLLAGGAIFLASVWVLLLAYGTRHEGSTGYALLGLLGLPIGVLVGYFGSRLARRWSTP